MAIAVTARSDGDPCPRVGIEFDWPSGAERVEVWRYVDTEASEVRGGRINSPSSTYLVDYEVPFGVAVTYEVSGWLGTTLVGTTGRSESVHVRSPHVDPSWVWLQDPLAPSTAMVLPMGGGSARMRQFSRPSQIVRRLGGRDATMIASPLGRASGISFALYAETSEISARLEDLFAHAAPVLLRSSPDVPLPRLAYLGIEEFEADPMDAHDAPARDWTIWRFTASIVRPPSASVVVPTYTWADFAVDYEGLTHADMAALRAGQTWLDWQKDPRRA